MTNTRTILMGLGTGVVFATLAVFFFADEMDVPAFLDGETGDAQSAEMAADESQVELTEPAAEIASTAESAEAPVVAALPEPEVSAAPEAMEEATATAESADVTTPTTEPSDPALQFDLVRVEPNGSTLVAGRAPAGLQLAILVDGARVATADAGADGKFVSFLDLPPAPRPRVLTLAHRDGDTNGTQGNQRVILAPVSLPAPAEEDAAQGVAALPVPEAESSAPEQPELETAMTAPDAPVAPAPLPIASDAPGAPTVLLADDRGMRVLQPGGSAPEVMEQVALDVISYDAEGDVNLAGRSTGAGHVRVYVDNEPVITSAIDDNGSWRVQLPEIDSGNYTLRVDEIAEDGSVASRLETPFRRESEDVLADAPRDASGAVTATVVPGSTLWAIAADTYGEGVLYVRVFEANRDKIRNPDLIYPGQIFDLPRD